MRERGEVFCAVGGHEPRELVGGEVGMRAPRRGEEVRGRIWDRDGYFEGGREKEGQMARLNVAWLGPEGMDLLREKKEREEGGDGDKGGECGRRHGQKTHVGSARLARRKNGRRSLDLGVGTLEGKGYVVFAWVIIESEPEGARNGATMDRKKQLVVRCGPRYSLVWP